MNMFHVTGERKAFSFHYENSYKWFKYWDMDIINVYTQVTSKCRIQSDATALSSRKITKRNSGLLPSWE